MKFISIEEFNEELEKVGLGHRFTSSRISLCIKSSIEDTIAEVQKGLYGNSAAWKNLLFRCDMCNRFFSNNNFTVMSPRSRCPHCGGDFR